MYLFFIINNFPNKNLNLQIFILFLFYFYFINETYVTYNEFISVLNESYTNLIYKVLNIISNIDLNLILISLFILKSIWFFFRAKIIFIKLALIFVFFEKNAINCAFKSSTIFTPINVNLLNGLFFFHPFILIILITLFYIFLKFNLKLNINLTLKCKKDFINSQSISNVILISSILLLFTGGWWAQQELNWGGWWAWDFVEQSNLNIFIFLLTLRHLTFFKKYNFNYNLFLFFICIVTYISTRYNLIPSIHSFLSELSFLQYDYLVNLFLSLIIIFLFKGVYFRNIKYVDVKLSPKLYLTFSLIKMLNIVLIINILFSIFFKNTGVLNIKIFQHLSILSIFIFLCIRYSTNLYINIFYVFNPIYINMCLYLYNFLSFWKNFKLIHIANFNFIMLGLLSWCYLDLFFINSQAHINNVNNLIYLKVNTFIYLNKRNINFNDTNLNLSDYFVNSCYFLKNHLNLDTLEKFNVNFIDNYFANNFKILININRVLLIYYYNYNLISLYLTTLFVLYFTIRLLFSNTKPIFNVFLLDLTHWASKNKTLLKRGSK